MRRRSVAVAVLAATLALNTAVPMHTFGSGPPELSKGQTLYVPVYSHIYWGAKARPYNLACTLSIRNTDLTTPITLLSVEYYDTNGKKIRTLLGSPHPIAPLATEEYYIEEKDTQGGSGANFIVRWSSDKPVNAPLVEAVMIGVEAAQGISFTAPARVILEHK